VIKGAVLEEGMGEREVVGSKANNHVARDFRAKNVATCDFDGAVGQVAD
jgi:hypothetical protein